MGTTPNAAFRYPAANDAPDGPGAIYNLAMDIDGFYATRLNGSVFQRNIGGAWRNWDSWWIDYSSTVSFPSSGITFNTTTARYRYVGGKVHVLYSGTMSTFSGGFVQVSLPVARDSAGGLAYSTAWAIHAGVRYQFTADFAANSVANFYRIDTGSNGAVAGMTGGSPVGWTAGDQFSFEMTYDI